MTAGSFSAAILLAQYLLPAAAQLWAGAALLFVFIASVFIKRTKALRFAALGLAAGLIWNYAYGVFGLRAARALDGTTQTVKAAVLSYPEDTDYGKSVLIRAGKAKCRLYIYDDDYVELAAGDEISVKAGFSLTGEKTGGDYYYSLGIPLFGYARGKPVVLGKAPFSILYIPARARRLLGNSIDASFRSTAPFIKAIVTGDRSDLKKEGYAYSLMSVTGIAHCVAVSGLHVSFLAGLVYFVLGKKRSASLVCIPAVLFFMAMTGFSASVARAGIMQLAVCGASLTRREYDAKTALFLSLMLLLAANPYSAQNAGLQLSFGATLGILLFGERLRAR
jgi:competence protein ComEC